MTKAESIWMKKDRALLRKIEKSSVLVDRYQDELDEIIERTSN